jgi:hypothetical protein
MKVTFKTAHGYLSFQPPERPNGPVRVEYREKAGPWEEVDLEGLEQLLQPVAPGPGHPPPGMPQPAPGPTPEATVAYVALVKAACLAAGLDLAGPCGAFAIVRRVAWGLRLQGYGLLSKPNGNNCEGFSTDVIVTPNRTGIVDLLGDGGGRNDPTWQVKENEVTADRWRAPVQP